MAKKGYTEKLGNTLTYYREQTEGAGDYALYTPPSGFNPTKKSFPLGKPVDLNYPTSNGSLDLTKYGNVTSLPNGFKFLDFMRRTDVPLSQKFQQEQLVMQLGLSEAERSDTALRPNIYVEIGGSQLNHATLGDLQQHVPFVRATSQQLCEALNRSFDTRYAGANRVGFNFETTYEPSGNTDSLSAALGVYGDGAWTCESAGLKGQTKTTTQLWNDGAGSGASLRVEIAQRMVNRHIALLLWVKGKCGTSTLVTNSDGVMAYYQGLPYNDDYFAERDALTGPASYYQYIWDTSANFDSFTVNGVTVTHGGKRYWDIADWMNMYRYPARGKLSNSDYDSLLGGGSGYAALWAKIMPTEWLDLALPTWFDVNQRKIASMGRTMPISWQTHYRFEDGIQRGDSDTHSKDWGLDEAVAPPWFNRATGAFAIMSAKNQGSGLTIWRTTKRWPDPTWDSAINSNRPHGDGLAYRAAFSELAKFAEYFDPANSPQLIYRNFIKYNISGGNWGSNVTDGGDGFYRRSPKDIGSGSNTDDARTKASVVCRVITKNGAKWALIVAANWRQSGLTSPQTTQFKLRFRPQEVSGLSANVDTDYMSIVGFEGLVIKEICLEPAKLGAVTGVITGPATALPYGFDFVPYPSITWGANDKLAITSGSARMERWLRYGGACCHLSESGGENMVNNFDWGRQLAMTLYGGPIPFRPPGVQAHETWNVGYDPIEMGSAFSSDSDLDNSEILAVGKTTNVNGDCYYIKSRAKQWDLHRYPTDCIYERWIIPMGSAVFKCIYKFTFDRADTFPYEAREQEYPCVHMLPKYRRVRYYAGSTPTFDQTPTVLDVFSGSVGSFSPDSSKDRNSVPLSENWIACTNPATERGFGVAGPEVYVASVRSYGGDGEGEFGGKSGYFSPMVQRIIDPKGVMYGLHYVVVGAWTDVRSYAASLSSGVDNRPNYVFKNKTRYECWYQKGGDQGEANITSELVITHQTGQIGFNTPFKPFAASGVSTIYVRMKNDSPRTDLVLAWRKVGQASGDESSQFINFSCPNDGAYHTISINVSADSDWSGIIAAVRIEQQSPREESAQTGRVWRIKYFSYLNRDADV